LTVSPEVILHQQIRKAMKTKSHTMIFLLICASLQVNSQTLMLIPVNLNEQKATHIKAIETKYFNGKVYLHITVNSNTETKMAAIERSIDA